MARQCGPAFVPPRVERRFVTSCNFRCTGVSVECEAVVLEHIGWKWERGGEGSGKMRMWIAQLPFVLLRAEPE